MQERNWNTEEAASYIGCTAGTLRVWTSQRRVPFLRVGGRMVRFKKSDLDRWLEAQKVEVEG